MKVKVSEFIADYFVKQGIDTIFTVVGGGAMHLNDHLVIIRKSDVSIIIMNRQLQWQRNPIFG